MKQFSPVMRGALKEQIAKWREKGQVGRPVRAMVVGIPNVGKSTFINKVAKKKSAKAGGPPWRHPGQAVGHRGPGAGTAGHPRHPLAQV